MSNQKIAAEIASLFGIKSAVSFDLHIQVGEVSKATITFIPDQDKVEKVMDLLSRYKIESFSLKEDDE